MSTGQLPLTEYVATYMNTVLDDSFNNIQIQNCWTPPDVILDSVDQAYNIRDVLCIQNQAWYKT